LEVSFDLSSYAPEFEIYINREVTPNARVRKSAVSVQINEQISDSAQYTLVLSDQLDIAKQEFVWLDNKMFDLGNYIRIDLGYAGSKLERMIEGPIKNLSTSGFSGDVPKLTLVGYDKSHNFLTEKSTSDESIKPDNKDTYSDIATKVAEKAGLEPIVTDTDEYSPTIAKKPITLNDFLRDTARRVGYEFFISREKLYFINPSDPRKPPTPSMTFTWGKDLMQFAPTINTSDLVTGIEVRGHLPNSKTKVVGIAKSGDEVVYEKGITASKLAAKMSEGKDNIKTVENKTFSSKQEADDMAKAELERMGRNLITASGVIVGNPNLLPGMWIEIKNVGERFSRRYYFVTSVTNNYGADGYTTSFNVRSSVIGEV
jgi:phage protein D